MVDPMLPHQQMREQQNMASQIETALQESWFGVGLIPFEVYNMLQKYYHVRMFFDAKVKYSIQYTCIYTHMYMCLRSQVINGHLGQTCYSVSQYLPKLELPDQICQLLLSSSRLHS